MKKIFLFSLSAIVILILILVINTQNFAPKPQQVPHPITIEIDTQKVKNRLADLLKFKTVSNQNHSNFNSDEFVLMQQYLQQTFPQVFSSLKKEIVNGHSLLLTWEGKNSKLKPVLFLAHQDVVPVPEENLSSWTHPPFAGYIDEKYIWGRGALDDKSSLTGILEAVTFLLKEGFQPQRTIYLAFGHDEEIGGIQGAAKIAQLLESRNVKLEFVLDEGGVIAQGLTPGVKPAVAMVGIAEKGYVSLKLSVTVEGGHSSMPPKHTAVGILSQAIVALESNPFPADSSYSWVFFDKIGRHMPYTKRLVFANAWLLKPVIESQLSKSKVTNSMIRTTTAATIFNSGIKDNVLPVSATAVVNFRILPGETVASVKQYVRKIINNPQIKITGEGRNPSNVSDVTSKSFQLLSKTIHQANGSGKPVIVAPYLVMGGTDSRNFEGLTNNIYRFLFNYAKPDDIKRIHSIDERISIENYVKVIRFYYQLMKNSDELGS